MITPTEPGGEENVCARPSALLISVLVLIALGFLPRGEAEAQGWIADLHAGRASYQTAPVASEYSNAIAGLRHSLDQRFFHVALAAPLSSEAPFWGVISVGDRGAFRRGRVELGFDATGQAHGQRDAVTETRGWGMRGQLMPVVSVSAGPLIAEARSGGSWYHGSVGDEEWSRNLHVSDLRISVPVDPTIRIGAEARQIRSGYEAYTFVGASGSAALGRGTVWASAGDWISGLDRGVVSSTGWGLGGSFAVTPSATLWASARSEPFDPVFLGPSRTSGGVGVSYRLGGGDAVRAQPRSAGPEHRAGGRVVLRLPLSDASSPPQVAGDFTAWTPIPMHRYGDHWRLELDLDPGIYHYAFRTGGGEWFVPESVPNRRDDGMGGWVAVLFVAGAGP